MSALDDLRIQRQLSIVKIDSAIARMERSISAGRSGKSVDASKRDLKVLLERFEALHVAVIGKEKMTMEEPNNLALLNETTDKVEDFLTS